LIHRNVKNNIAILKNYLVVF